MLHLKEKLKEADKIIAELNILLMAKNSHVTRLNDEVHELHLSLQQSHNQLVKLRNVDE